MFGAYWNSLPFQQLRSSDNIFMQLQYSDSHRSREGRRVRTDGRADGDERLVDHADVRGSRSASVLCDSHAPPAHVHDGSVCCACHGGMEASERVENVRRAAGTRAGSRAEAGRFSAGLHQKRRAAGGRARREIDRVSPRTGLRANA